MWDGDQIVMEVVNNAVTARYIRGINLIAIDTGTTRSYYLFNGHGDVTALTDASGNVLKSYDYDAFGNEKNPDANDVNPFRYCGEYFDKETGTIYLRARYYNPANGRFISEDSYLGKDNDPLSLNLYTYCANNPVNSWDPTGHWRADVHKDRTYEMAQNAGFTDTQAKIISDADESVDHGDTDPKSISYSNLSWHFNRNDPGEMDSRWGHFLQCYYDAVYQWNNADVTGLQQAYEFNEQFGGGKMTQEQIFALAKTKADNERNSALATFGKGLHPLQDIDAHQDWAEYESIVTPHRIKDESPLTYLFGGSDFDNADVDIYKDKDGNYKTDDSGIQYGSYRYSQTVDKTTYWMNQFQIDTHQKK